MARPVSGRIGVRGTAETYRAALAVTREILMDVVEGGPKAAVELLERMVEGGPDLLDYLAERYPKIQRDVSVLNRYLLTTFPRRVNLARMKGDFEKLRPREQLELLAYGTKHVRDNYPMDGKK